MKKRGRNEPCHCASGLKYKKCCEASDKHKTRRLIRDSEGRLVAREEISTLWEAQDKRVVAVGNRIVLMEPHETRHEFFFKNLAIEYGDEWRQEQSELPEDERHPVERWWRVWGQVRSGELAGVEVKQEGERLYTSEMPGDVKALLCLAYDLYTLRDKMSLPEPLITRLRNRNEFQGARYEAAVAAVFARAGYEIGWISDTSKKLPEFIARQGPVEIAVEAKSRRRPGVMGHPGEKPDRDELGVDVGRLLRDALKKETSSHPYIVCIDLNLPTDVAASSDDLVQEVLKNVLIKYGSEKTDGRLPYAALLFTNYSWQWDGYEPAGNPIHLPVRAANASVPIPPQRLDPVIEALHQYGSVPS
jgi:SEC-C motif